MAEFTPYLYVPMPVRMPMMSEEECYRVLKQTPNLPELGEATLRQYARLMELLCQEGQLFNLTAITEPEKIALIHFADSLSVLGAAPEIGQAERCVDIGAGAGFPALSLAILHPGTKWTAVESVHKKCVFIEKAAEKLGLGNMEVHCTRAEELGRGQQRESFDFATARAVGPVASLSEIGLPLLRVSGKLLLYKTAAAATELHDAEEALRLLGGEVEPSYHYSLQGDHQERTIFRICKKKVTSDKYPRASGMPFKRPLGRN